MRWLLIFGFFSIFTTQAQTLTVFAASSLSEAFTANAAAFEERHPGSNVVLNFAGSSTLATQLEQGAPADVFASADWPNLLRVIDTETAEAAQVFATNKLVVITPPESPITSLETLASEKHLLVLAGEEVPAGRYAREVLGKLEDIYGPNYQEDVLRNLVSNETNVRQVTAKIVLGEADAAIVYATDAKTLANVATIAIPEAHNVRAEYPAVVIGVNDLAPQFLEFLLSDEGQSILASHGFSHP